MTRTNGALCVDSDNSDNSIYEVLVNEFVDLGCQRHQRLVRAK